MSALPVEKWPNVARVTEDLAAMGADIRVRRERYGMGPGDLAEVAGVSRSTIYAVEKGTARGRTVRQVLSSLESWEEEAGVMAPPSSDAADDTGRVTFRLKGNFGVDVTVQGPIESLEDLERSVERLLAKMEARRGD